MVSYSVLLLLSHWFLSLLQLLLLFSHPLNALSLSSSPLSPDEAKRTLRKFAKYNFPSVVYTSLIIHHAQRTTVKLSLEFVMFASFQIAILK